MHDVLREELWRHAKISVHHGKTCIWNRGGVIPDRCDELEAAARAVHPRARVWRGSHDDRFEEQGITILGTPVGRPEFVERELAKILADHSELLTRILEVQDLQCAWLLLLFCGGGRANFYIRTVRPELTAAFSGRSGSQCEGNRNLAFGGREVGLRSASRLREIGPVGLISSTWFGHEIMR